MLSDKVKRWIKPHWVKPLSLVILVGAALILSWFAFGHRSNRITSDIVSTHFRRRFSNLGVREWVAFITPITAYIIARFTHWLDEICDGGGLRHRVYDISGERFSLDADVIAATMTKQSVLAAIAAILLTIVIEVRHNLPQSAPNEPISFPFLATELSTIGFLLSILLLLVSMKCYDYAARFNLPETYRITLIDKGLDLDILSWYLLLFSFALGIASMSVTLSILLSFIGGYSLWWYYFIHPKPRRPTSAQPNNGMHPTASHVGSHPHDLDA